MLLYIRTSGYTPRYLYLGARKMFSLKPKYQNDDDIPHIAKEPIPNYLPFEQIVAAQGGFSMDKFNETVDKIDFTTFEDESLEDMLNTLTK